MSTQQTPHPQFEISVTTMFVPAESKPDQGYHFFAYRISIKNSGRQSAQLISRHWVITDAFGRIEEVKGPGVVGQQPKIGPGQVFEYESACPLPTSSGSMKGQYQMIGDNGDNFAIEIPEFFLVAPHALH